ncbi:alkaline phosphatase family protein [Actinomyces bowdenii]|uniref:alkaline phosphatase family protein n=1 Tax=Actinomyces bowdenii TaxID=131109 RepID=UPI001ABD39E8|nr:alkaline phosphatase family protein [Actinomyces bowdenii]MBO3725198.1 alkaline phosphatase family protein [Actinomyces bowdenii]
MSAPSPAASPPRRRRGGADPDGPGLRGVLAAAAVGAGLSLSEAGTPAALSDDQARALARAWGMGESAGTVLVLVDGLGMELLAQRMGHAATLRSWLAQTRADGAVQGAAVSTCAPSTTAAALTMLGTTALPGATGMVGYSVLSPQVGPVLPAGSRPHPDQLLSLISWQGSDIDPGAWQPVPTVFERLRTRGGAPAPAAVSIGPARFAGSGLTVAGLRGAEHLGADRLEARPGLAARALRRGTPLVYLYVGELDHTGHSHGWRSQEWLAQLERLDAAMAELRRRVPSGTRIILTADHGMVDTDDRHRLTIPAVPALARDVVAVAGEPRFTHLHVADGDESLAQQVAHRWREELGERAAWVGTRREAAAHLGPLSERARGVVGDVVVAMAGRWVALDPRAHSAAAMAMPGVHGSLTRDETLVPLLITRT